MAAARGGREVRRILRILLCALLGVSGARMAAGVVVAPLGSSRALLAGLHSSGRAEAALSLHRLDPLSGRTNVVRGRLILEQPRLARLELEDGQRLTLRADGGDWLQPATRQLVRAGARSAAGVLVWWGALLDPQATGVQERKVGTRQYLLTRPGAGEALVQRIELGADGLPRRLMLEMGPGERVEYRLTRWRFVRSRGPADFVLQAPTGFEVVELP
jgi:hypothetical protein